MQGTDQHSAEYLISLCSFVLIGTNILQVHLLWFRVQGSLDVHCLENHYFTYFVCLTMFLSI